MTIIATDGKTIAADGLVSGNGLKHAFNCQKLFRLKSGAVMGLSGTPFYQKETVAFLNGEKEAIDFGDDMEAIVLYPDGRIECIDGKGRVYEQPAPAVTGSGGAVALGAMLAGASPIEAVRIAAAAEQGCGGECTEMTPTRAIQEVAA